MQSVERLCWGEAQICTPLRCCMNRMASPGPFSCTGDVVVGDSASDLAFGQRTD